MNWQKFVKDVIPVAAGITGSAAIDSAAKLLEDAVDAHLTNQAAASGTNRDELLKQYQADWQSNIDEADALLKKGHDD